jgi:chromosome partitioning protein
MKAIISVANIAGRVGRSMTAACLATELAMCGHKALLIDADPQAGATEYFIPAEQVRLSLLNVLVGRAGSSQPRPASAPQPECQLSDAIEQTKIEKLGLMPSKIGLARFEREPTFSIFRLKSRLEFVRNDYDYVILDTPPYLGRILTACLVASTHLLIPVAPAPRVLEGPECLLTLTEELRSVFSVRLLGVVCNLLERQHPPSWELATGKEQWFKEVALKSMIFRDNQIEECRLHHRPIQEFAPDSRGASMIANLTDELLLRLSK